MTVLSIRQTTEEYAAFLSEKTAAAPTVGFTPHRPLNARLFDWQQAIVAWAAERGTAALFAECGLGKTVMQLEYAQLVHEHCGPESMVLIVAPLAVVQQTVREGERFGYAVNAVRASADLRPGLNIVNYDMVKHIDAGLLAGVVLDESSILKAYTGAMKRLLLSKFASVPFRLCATATPAPNDYLELGNHAEFLGVMPANEMLMRWFINNPAEAGDYRLKHHAREDFWRWVASWAVSLTKPSDLGDYDDTGYELPPLELCEHTVQTDLSRAWAQGKLFNTGGLSATELWREKAATAEARCQRAAALVTAEPDEAWVIWCDTNDEADRLKALLPEAVEVRGADKPEVKAQKLWSFTSGECRSIITKPEIAGFGLNWQHASRACFVGLTYSFEQFYQALRRQYRFGQTRPVAAHIIAAETEGDVIMSVRRKAQQHQELQQEMTEAIRQHGLGARRTDALNAAQVDLAEGDGWQLYLGDCVTRTAEIAADSVALTVSSLPFANLYIYSDSVADMGNCADQAEFFKHFGYLLPELWRITAPGRLCVMHCKDLPLYQNRDGAFGLYDFPGDVRAAFEACRPTDDPADRWVLHSKVTIWKDPVTEMQRTKNHGLLHKNFADRAEVVRQGMADYLYVFRKVTAADIPDKQVRHNKRAPRDAERIVERWEVNPEESWDFGLEPGTTEASATSYQGGQAHPDYIGTQPPQAWTDDRDYSIKVWQRYASPVWYDINQMDVLNYELARSDRDEKHICPLQLDVIARCIDLWTNPGELVFDPFAGVGSTGHEALQLKRRFVGVELKESYWRHAQRHLTAAALKSQRQQLPGFEDVAA